MNIFKSNQSALGLIFILILALVLSPIVSFGDDGGSSSSYDQVGQYTDYNDINPDGTVSNPSITNPEQITTEGATGNLYAKYSKSITGTATENQFDITLNVETNEELDKIYKSSNILLVFDVSGSMDYKIGTSTTITQTQINNGDKSRWLKFKAAMEGFIDDFLAANEGDNTNSVSIAVFGGSSSNPDPKDGSHKTIQTWTTNASIAKSSFNKDFASGIRAANYPNSGDKGIGQYTNGEAGFKAASDVLANSTYNSQYTSVVVISDGIFNRAYSTSSSSTDALQNAAITQAGKLKALPCCDAIYTFAMGDDAADSKAMTPGDNDNPHLNSLLVADDDTIIDAFNNLEETIQRTVQPWSVTDPMSKWVTIDENSISVEPMYDYYEPAIVEDSVLKWNLKKTQPVITNGSEGEGNIYNYTLTYTITLNTGLNDFPWDEWIATNEQTTLTYVYSYDLITEHTVDFYIPTVKAENPNGDIKIKKLVAGDAPTDDTFNFIVKIGGTPYTGKYKIDDGNEQNMDNGKLTLQGGEIATLIGLPIGSSVNVTEIPKAYYTVEGDSTKSGVVVKNTNTILFTNNYSKSNILNGEKTSDPESGSTVKNGDDIKYTITVTNDDSVTATGVVVKDYIPLYTSLSAVYDDGISDSDGNGDYVTWYVGDLAPGASAEVSFLVDVIEEFNDQIENMGMYKQTGEATSEGALNNDDEFDDTNVVVHFPPAPKMNIQKSNTPGNDEFVNGGEDIIYTLKIINTSDVTLHNVWIKDFIPANTTYKAGTASDNGLYDSNGNYVQWLINTIPVGASAEVSFTVVVDDDVASGTVITNVALGEILGVDKVLPEVGNPGQRSNEVNNKVPPVLPDTADPEDKGAVQGESAHDPDNNPTVLGEEARTADDTNAIPYLLIMLLAAGAVMVVAMKRMSRKEQ